MDYDLNEQTVSDAIIDYIDNLEFSNSTHSQPNLAPVNRTITKNIISTYFSRFKNDNSFSKMKVKLFNKKLEKIYTMILGTILRYAKYIPNTIKNTNDNYVIYDSMKKLSFYNLISNTMTNSKNIHENMMELFTCNRNKKNKKNIVVVDSKYNKFFYEMLYDILTISDFKFDKKLMDENNFNLSINTMLKLISTYCLKNECYKKTLYPYNVNGSVIYRDIKVINFAKLPYYNIIFDKIIELCSEKNESILKTFILLMEESSKKIILIPKNYSNNTKISFTYIEIINDNIYTSEAKLEISKLYDQINNIYIKVFGFSSILRFLINKETNNFDENVINKITKIIEKTQEKLKSK